MKVKFDWASVLVLEELVRGKVLTLFKVILRAAFFLFFFAVMRSCHVGALTRMFNDVVQCISAASNTNKSRGWRAKLPFWETCKNAFSS